MATSRAATRRDLRHYYYRAALAAAGTASVGVSLYTRRWRDEKLSGLSPAASSGAFFVGDAVVDAMRSAGAPPRSGEAAAAVARCDDSSAAPSSRAAGMSRKRRRDLRELSTTVARAGLMGTSVSDSKSVAAELDAIREWHRKRGFLGGLVLRELNRPLFGESGDDDVEGGDDVEPIPRSELDRRECYFLYYEVMPDGELRQQIFCRGTTLAADVGTCLATHLVRDDELGGCRLHAGFRDHAERLIRDVEPLLAPTTNRRATVELCGHSLGGAVAFIAALKMRERGHNVVRVTSVAAPRFCGGDAATVRALTRWLPPDALRIEDDLDAVTYLPPFGGSLGDKLWFVTTRERDDGGEARRRRRGKKKGAYFVPAESAAGEDGWVDSVWANVRIPETLAHIDKVHRVPSYVANIEHLTEELGDLLEPSLGDGVSHDDASPVT